ncbi:MAG TPA: branched-chain amino acid ABC transporter permease [Candidatus Baltobacteraceae bacterium]|nr:branched-chain amino acid ABC transporter permease [Candidatus Baltobacteraceae bacterium]
MNASRTSAARARRSGVLAGDVRFLIFTAIGLAAFPLALHAVGGYGGLATQICILSVAAIGFNVLLGYAGMLSYGHAMFYGGGGYLAAILLMRAMPAHPNLWLAVLGATIATAALALAIGSVTVRLYGIYFALLTLAFAQMVFFIVEQGGEITGGDDGLQSFPNALLPIGPWSIDLTAPVPPIDMGPLGTVSDLKLWYVFAAIVLLLVLWFTRALTRSQFGEVLGAIRENEERSLFVGFNAATYRLAAFAISGALTGFAGAMRALYDGTVAVDSLGIDRSGSFVIYTIVGGVQTVFGPVVGTAIIVYLENVLSGVTPLWRLIEGLIFIAAIVFLPSGIVGTLGGRGKRGRRALFGALRARPATGVAPPAGPAPAAVDVPRETNA